ENFRLPSCTYDLLVNFYYLDRALAPQMVRALRPDGVLVFETFTVDQERFGWGPDRQDYLLQPGELKRLFADLQTLHYDEGVKDSDRGHKAIASLIARKPGGGPT
ncbi:MAG: SAM-dependent methyltransferase, partial [Dehalococcoidia bacterium]|nr:SAM-dependent methyltransferase [Dehalococcoidia bacterium]